MYPIIAALVVNVTTWLANINAALQSLIALATLVLLLLKIAKELRQFLRKHKPKTPDPK
ncbi:MAG: hypothetical protein AB1705_14600 [Verrucomicrobiota bacterium]